MKFNLLKWLILVLIASNQLANAQQLNPKQLDPAVKYYADKYCPILQNDYYSIVNSCAPANNPSQCRQIKADNSDNIFLKASKGTQYELKDGMKTLDGMKILCRMLGFETTEPAGLQR